MVNNLKKRFFTSLILFSILYLMYLNTYVLGYFIIIIGVLSILEFFRMILKIFNKRLILKSLINLLFATYIFLTLTVFLSLSFFSHLKILIFIILLTCIASDLGGFVFGKIFKGPKLTKISPNKTISGAIGSLIFSVTLIFLIFFYLIDNMKYEIIFVGLSTSISCQIGDLFFSYLKRKSLMKDTGKILPGHGGILDRIDGMLLGVPIGFITLVIIY